MAVTAMATVAGCSHIVSGTAQRADAGSTGSDRGYGYVDDRCGLLVDTSIQEFLKADNIVRPYSGAVCQYVLSRSGGPNTAPLMLDVVFSWFESGSLEREHAVAQDRKAQITDTVVERHQAFLARRDVTGAACSATAAAGSGVLSWWVQYRGQNGGDPCRDAQMLLSKTLQAEL